MPKRKRSKRRTMRDGGRRRGRFSRFRRRHKDRRISIIGTTGAVGSIFAGASNHKSLGSWAVDFATGKESMSDFGNKAPYILSDTIAQYTGYSFIDGTWNIPMGTLVLIGSSIAAGIAGRFGNKYISRLPFVGKYIKM